jgi:hypothetical protein
VANLDQQLHLLHVGSHNVSQLDARRRARTWPVLSVIRYWSIAQYSKVHESCLLFVPSRRRKRYDFRFYLTLLVLFLRTDMLCMSSFSRLVFCVLLLLLLLLVVHVELDSILWSHEHVRFDWKSLLVKVVPDENEKTREKKGGGE